MHNGQRESLCKSMHETTCFISLTFEAFCSRKKEQRFLKGLGWTRPIFDLKFEETLKLVIV